MSIPEQCQDKIARLEAELAAALQLREELQSVLQWAKEERAAVTAERDALLRDVHQPELCDEEILRLKANMHETAEVFDLDDTIGGESLSDYVRRQVSKIKAERDALKAKLATINHIAMSLFVRTTSSEVTGEMAEIGRLSREDGQ